MKVLFVIDTLEVGGAEKSILEMALHFSKTDISVCHLYKGDQLKSDCEAAGIKVYSLQLQGQYSFYQAYTKLKQVIEREKPDLVHSALLRSSLVSRVLCHRLKIPLMGSLVADSYSSERYRSSNFLRKLKLFFFQVVDRLTVHWCHHFIAISQTIALSNARHLKIKSTDITVIYRGRQISSYSKIVSSPSNDQPFQFITVGRLVGSKGHVDLIHSFCEQNIRQRSAKLLIVGKGPEQKKLQRLITENQLEETILLLGERNDVPALLSHSNAFLFPSHYEGLGGALIEAMMSGLPVICSDIPVFREYVNPSETGLLAPVANPKEWSKLIAWVMDHQTEALAMGQKAQQMASLRFDIRIITAKYEQLYYTVYENSATRYQKAI